MRNSIDLRDTKCVYINLDTAERNKEEMDAQLGSLEFKDFERLSARVVAPPTPEPPPEYGSNADTWWNIFRGVAQSHIDILETNDAPVLILEDDSVVTEDFRPILENIPEDTDGIYLGISQSDGKYNAYDIGSGYAWIRGIFSTHAILYLSERYKNAVLAMAKDWAYNKNFATDIGWCRLQNDFNIITPHKPFFYQADDRESLNKWGNLTKTPLRLKELPVSKPSSPAPIGPIGAP